MKKFYVRLLSLAAAVCCIGIFCVFVASGEDFFRTLLSVIILAPIAFLCAIGIARLTGPEAEQKETRPTQRLRNA